MNVTDEPENNCKNHPSKVKRGEENQPGPTPFSIHQLNKIFLNNKNKFN